MDWEREPSFNGSDQPRRPPPRPTFGRVSTLLLVVAAVIGALAGWALRSGGQSGELELPAGQALVVGVVDGDTVELEIGGQRERVRLLGIDAPETVHPTVPVQCFGPEASAGLTELLPPDTIVRVERDEELRDRFGRLLLYLYRVEDGLFVNGWLLSVGLADVSFYEPNTALAAPLTKARTAARTAGLGLWGNCEGPDQPLQ